MVLGLVTRPSDSDSGPTRPAWGGNGNKSGRSSAGFKERVNLVVELAVSHRHPTSFSPDTILGEYVFLDVFGLYFYGDLFTICVVLKYSDNAH